PSPTYTLSLHDALPILAFHRYLSKEENLKKFLRIFPFVATTCISAQRLGDPEPAFDMVIMDEASQCNTAVSLVPIVRGNSLMLRSEEHTSELQSRFDIV